MGRGVAQLVVCEPGVPAARVQITAETHSGRGDFSLGVNMGSNSIPRKRLPRWPWGKASASRAEGPGFVPAGLSHTTDFNIGTPVATLPGAWRDRVSAGTGRPGVSIL